MAADGVPIAQTASCRSAVLKASVLLLFAIGAVAVACHALWHGGWQCTRPWAASFERRLHAISGAAGEFLASPPPPPAPVPMPALPTTPPITLALATLPPPPTLPPALLPTSPLMTSSPAPVAPPPAPLPASTTLASSPPPAASASTPSTAPAAPMPRQQLLPNTSAPLAHAELLHRPWACGLVEVGVNYLTRQAPVRTVTYAATPGDCRGLCIREPECSAWTWAQQADEARFGYCAAYGCIPFRKGHACQCNAECKRFNSCCVDFEGQCLAGEQRPKLDAGNCVLKHLEQAEFPVAERRPGLVSGALPCEMQEFAPAGVLYCFALMVPTGYEPHLLKMQHALNVSIFACDGYTIYSNRSIQLLPGVRTAAVESDLRCRTGGEFGTWLNLGIFLVVWRRVYRDGLYRAYDWTAKVDPDAVFFPHRLKSALAHHAASLAEAAEGVYLNNCRMGLHGPLEVLSKTAVTKWVTGSARCLAHFEKLCSGDCKWGEDMFMDQCLWKVLKVRRESDWTLLSERHCEPQRGLQLAGQEEPEWSTCASGHAAFHPFKEEHLFRMCMASASQHPEGSTPESMRSGSAGEAGARHRNASEVHAASAADALGHAPVVQDGAAPPGSGTSSPAPAVSASTTLTSATLHGCAPESLTWVRTREKTAEGKSQVLYTPLCQTTNTANTTTTTTLDVAEAMGRLRKEQGSGTAAASCAVYGCLTTDPSLPCQCGGHCRSTHSCCRDYLETCEVSGKEAVASVTLEDTHLTRPSVGLGALALICGVTGAIVWLAAIGIFNFVVHLTTVGMLPRRQAPDHHDGSLVSGGLAPGCRYSRLLQQEEGEDDGGAGGSDSQVDCAEEVEEVAPAAPWPRS